MKHKSHIPRLLKGVMLGAITLSASLAGANNFIMPQKSASLLQREQEAFLNPNVNTIPFEKTTKLKDGGLRQNKQSVFESQPIESNPILLNKLLSHNGETLSSDELIESFKINTSWGSFQKVEDGKLYYYTQENEPSMIVKNQQYYKGSKFTIFNDEFQEIKSFNISTMDTVMSFKLLPVSSKVFNSSDDWEFTVQTHGFNEVGVGPTACRDTIYIINENNDVIRKIGDASSISIDKYSTYPGLYKYNACIARPNYNGIHKSTLFRFYNPKDIGNSSIETPTPLYTFEKENKYLSYSTGPIFSIFESEGKYYYVASYYEKPFVVETSDPRNPEVEKDNTFIVDIYDTSFKLIKSSKLPLIGQDSHEWSMSTLYDGFLEYMLTQTTFNNDDKFEFIYGMSRYYEETDSEQVDFYLVDEDGNILKELPKGSAGAIKLSTVNGQEDEYAIFIGTSDAINEIIMYKVPSLEPSFTFPARYNNDLLSLYFDRYPVKDSYEYVFSLGSGESFNNKLYGIVAYYDVTGRNTKRVRIELPSEVVRFSTIIQANMLNPYLFVSDEKPEFAYFVSEPTDDGGLKTTFGIANEETTLYRWTDDKANDLFINGAGIGSNTDNTKIAYLYVNELENMSRISTTKFYSLPLNKQTLKGNGTKSNPYLISSPTELEMIRENTTASYALANDIDMSQYTGVSGNGFQAIADFKGSFDGRGHTIKNITLCANKNNIGLFATISNATISNLRLENVHIYNTADVTGNIGIIAGGISNTIIDNCHVLTDIQTEQKWSSFGGLIGQMTNNAKISNSSFIGEIIAPNCSDIGGIASNATTEGSINNCFTSGSIHGNKSISGILASISSNSMVTNCYSTMNIMGSSYLSGIVANGSGIVNNNYSTGQIESDLRESEKWKNKGGGIIASIAQSMFENYGVSNNVALNPYVLMGTDYARIGIAEETSDGTELMKNNYALASMKIGSSKETLATVDENDETTVGLNKIHGKSVTEDELTQEFFENLGWKFGNDSINPWRMEGKYPSLWFEYRVQGVKLDNNKITMGIGQKLTVNATVIPEKAENKKVRYESSDMRVAIVDANGEITARAKGTAVIKAISEDGNYTDQCVVTVINAIESITLDQTELTLYVLDGIELTPTINPEDADNTELIWTSSNPEVATVDNGIVRAIAAGEAEITVKAAVGDASATCKVTVFPAVDEFYFETSSISLNKENPTQQLHVTIKPEEAQNIPLRWESDNEAVATVDAEGLVSAVGDGDAIITAMTTDRLHKADCLVMVTDFGSGIDEVTNKAMIIVTDNALTISSDLNISRVMGVDIAGVTVFDNAVNGNQTTVMTSALQPGAYIVKVLYENGNTTTHKIIIK